jgi:hypothetical protein
MAKHDVSFNIPQRALGKADVEFLVKRDGAVLGTLAVSNGSIVWFPKGTTYGLKVGWKKFNDIMQVKWTPPLGQQTAVLRWFIRVMGHQAASAHVLAV